LNRLASQPPASEAPAGFDDLTNGFVDQATFDADREVFEEQEFVDDGLGPVYNAQSCGECHQSPVAGAISQLTELRAGHRDFFGRFIEAPGGSLIHDRAIDAAIQERVPPRENLRTFRTSLNTRGDGFVEAIDSNTLRALSFRQFRETGGRIAGQVIQVPVLEAGGARRVGRFGWKNQHASLVSFAADAYLNEMGITSPLQPLENSSLGNSVAAFDSVPDPEDDGEDVERFARFMRATRVPPRDEALAATPEAIDGSLIFNDLGCAHCHVSTLVTAPPGTVINGGAFTVPEALGNKILHPFGDFLLHDVGTGDGIVQNGGASTANRMRTAPLWGLRTRVRLMHDGESLTYNEAILRHGGEAALVTLRYRLLNEAQRSRLFTFLRSL
jgi:CxxC motif-containing protein (DUF1111 family)